MKKKKWLILLAIPVLLSSVLLVKIPVIANMLDGEEFCGACHIMEPHVNTYKHGTHREVASCSDCHIPHTLVGGSYYKAYTGIKDVVYVLADHTDHQIVMTDLAKTVLNNNCRECHSERISQVDGSMGQGDRNCFDCHKEVRHTR